MKRLAWNTIIVPLQKVNLYVLFAKHNNIMCSVCKFALFKNKDNLNANAGWTQKSEKWSTSAAKVSTLTMLAGTPFRIKRWVRGVIASLAPKLSVRKLRDLKKAHEKVTQLQCVWKLNIFKNIYRCMYKLKTCTSKLKLAIWGIFEFHF